MNRIKKRERQKRAAQRMQRQIDYLSKSPRLSKEDRDRKLQEIYFVLNNTRRNLES